VTIIVYSHLNVFQNNIKPESCLVTRRFKNYNITMCGFQSCPSNYLCSWL